MYEHFAIKARSTKSVACTGEDTCLLCARFPIKLLVEMRNPETGNVHQFYMTSKQWDWARGRISLAESTSPLIYGG